MLVLFSVLSGACVYSVAGVESLNAGTLHTRTCTLTHTEVSLWRLICNILSGAMFVWLPQGFVRACIRHYSWRAAFPWAGMAWPAAQQGSTRRSPSTHMHVRAHTHTQQQQWQKNPLKINHTSRKSLVEIDLSIKVEHTNTFTHSAHAQQHFLIKQA